MSAAANGPQCPIPEGARIDRVRFRYERYGPTGRWPKPNWRYYREDSDAYGPVQSPQDVDAVLRKAMTDPFVYGQRVLWLESDHGALLVSGFDRRIVIPLVADPRRVDPWTHDHLKIRLREFAVSQRQH